MALSTVPVMGPYFCPQAHTAPFYCDFPVGNLEGLRYFVWDTSPQFLEPTPCLFSILFSSVHALLLSKCNPLSFCHQISERFLHKKPRKNSAKFRKRRTMPHFFWKTEKDAPPFSFKFGNRDWKIGKKSFWVGLHCFPIAHLIFCTTKCFSAKCFLICIKISVREAVPNSRDEIQKAF